MRRVSECVIIENKQYLASFMHDQSYILIVKGPGFGRHQVRMMMAFLFEVGRGNLNSNQLDQVLNTGNIDFPLSPAPPSGLILHKVAFAN
jgi:tRNA pseudouridine38-40 synthase